MAYTVLARKYRSRTFDEVIGQEPIATTLAHAIETGRIHHGYLFTGTRGVGKTSMARILAKSLNCLKADAPTTHPCCECEACVAIGEGQDIDVVEIDAASNTGVDNIRELRSNTAYRPARCRFKVYIIDEVHMLSTGAFNALLKTLEEPPDHVKFILATTEIQKVPATIQSRCQKYNFRNISPADIAARLTQIITEEGATADEAVVKRIARLANGSMRDALSVLDQLLSVSPDKLSTQVLDEILPPPQNEQIVKLLGRAAHGEVAAALATADEILSGGRGLEVFCSDAIEVVRSLMLIRACGPDSDIVDFPAGDRDEYTALAGKFDLSQYVQMIAMLEELRRNVRFSAAGRALVDAVIVRLAKMHDWSSIEELLAAGAGDIKKNAPVSDPPARRQPAATPAPHTTPPASRTNGSPHAPAQRTKTHEPAPPSRPTPAETKASRLSTATPEPGVQPTSGVEPESRINPESTVGQEPRVRRASRPPGATPRVGRASRPTIDRGQTEPTGKAATLQPDEPTSPSEAPPASDPTEGLADEFDPPASDNQRQPRTRPLSSDERARVENDPIVREVLDLFDGVIIDAVQELAPPAADQVGEPNEQETTQGD